MSAVIKISLKYIFDVPLRSRHFVFFVKLPLEYIVCNIFMFIL